MINLILNLSWRFEKVVTLTFVKYCSFFQDFHKCRSLLNERSHNFAYFAQSKLGSLHDEGLFFLFYNNRRVKKE